MPLDEPDYVPCLKAREAEIKALLRAPAALQVLPLFELQKASPGGVDRDTGQPRRAKATTTDVSYFLDDIARLWNAPVYVDICRIADPGSASRWWTLLSSLNALASTPAELIPVLHLDAAQPEMVAAAQVAAGVDRLALRVPMYQRPAPATIAAVMATLSSTSGIAAEHIDVLLDWADHTESLTLDDLVTDTESAITALGSKHGHVICLGTPNSAAFVQSGDWDVARREWWLWLRLDSAGRSVVYGDYALYPPSDPVPVQPQYGHLRYSSDDRLHVHRRTKPSGGGGLAAAFAKCCQQVVTQPHWLGAGFSAADQRVADIASNADKESVPGKWRQIAAEHHFALVAQQMNTTPPPPAPGTT